MGTALVLVGVFCLLAVFTSETNRRIALEIALGLAAVHRAQIMHHDLRAANVLVGPKPRVCRLTDFGLSKTRQQSSKSSNKSGNPIWLSPE